MRAPARDLGRRFGGFALAPLLGTLASLVSLPVIAREFTAEQWVTYAAAQSVGTVASVAVGLGWGLSGPSRLAVAGPERRVALLHESLATRLIAAVLVLPVAAVAAIEVSPAGNAPLAVAMMLSIGLAGLSPAWFYVATGSPGGLLHYDVLPRVVAALAGAALLVGGAPPLVFPALLILAGLWGTCVSLARIAGRRGGSGPWRRWWPWLRRQLAPAMAELAGSSYSVAGGALVASQVTVPQMAAYASGWRLYLLALAAVVVSSRALQSWVLRDTLGRTGRVTGALRVHMVLGAAGLVLIPATGPYLTGLLFGDPLSISAALGLAFGTAFLAVSVSTALSRYVLVPAGRTRVVLHSAVLGCVVGIPLILALANGFGAVGGAWGLAVTELVVLGWQVPSSVRFRRGRPHEADAVSG